MVNDGNDELMVPAVMRDLLERGRVEIDILTPDELKLLTLSIEEAERRIERMIHVRTGPSGLDGEVSLYAWLCQPVEWDRTPMEP